MAPILALVAYALTGYLAKPKPVTGGEHRLLLSGDCRPADNACHLIAGDLTLKLISTEKQNRLQLGLIASKPVDVLSLALGDASGSMTQFRMMKSDDGTYWQVQLEDGVSLRSFTQLRLAAAIGQAKFFTDTRVIF